MTRTGAAAILSAAFIATGGAALAQSGGAALTVQNSDEYGAYIADDAGMSLYIFEADTQGQGGQAAVSACEEDCAAAWPPLISDGTPAGSDQIQADLVGTIQRADGTTQVTYNGWPLYYFVKDQKAGDTTGHDVEGFGAEWYLLTPEGEKAED